MQKLGKAHFGAVTFCGSNYPSDKCGPNGLPLTPTSIKILGKFQKLRSLRHRNLCKYLDLNRLSKHERVIVVAEFYESNLENKMTTDCLDEKSITKIMYQSCDALSYLNSLGIVHRALEPKSILLDYEGNAKLSNYGLYYMTGNGADVSFPIGSLKYFAPEILAVDPVVVDWDALVREEPHLLQPPSDPKVDVWSLGVVMLQLYMRVQLWQTLTLKQVLFKILSFIIDDKHEVVEAILIDHGQKVESLPDRLTQFLAYCLLVDPTKRPLPEDLLKHDFFAGSSPVTEEVDHYMFSSELRCRDMDLNSFYDENITDDEDYLGERPIDEAYYYWKLAGGDLEGTVRKSGLIRSRPPVTTLPSLVTAEGEVFGTQRDDALLMDDTVFVLPQDTLRMRLASVNPTIYYPLLEDPSGQEPRGLPTSPSSVDLTETTRLPLVIREGDVEYQLSRCVLFSRLLLAYPFKRPLLWREARVDVPPLLRAKIWAALLEVEGDVRDHYDMLDKVTMIAADRQIEVDIPRCHQYNELLSSPEGHLKFKRVLKAWVVSHPQYVYWQGLDSLCAPFLYLNFNDEALAYACLSAFIPKYLHNFFLKDNSAVIQEYLAVFSHLVAFHDPLLSNHLDGIGFIPDLYAIPWFLTMYAHVFPLHKIFHLWDTLLLGNSSLPLCIGVAILRQLREALLNSGFNECILMFSDMPEINIEKCVNDSIDIFCATPKSATYRQHARPAKRKAQREDRETSPRPLVSYYSHDYNDRPRTELSMDAVSLAELKSERCPRVSAEDLLELSGLACDTPSRSPTRRSGHSKPKLVMVDVRSSDEYKRGAVPGSLNIPFDNAFDADDNLVPTPAVQKLLQQGSLVKVIIGNRGTNAVNFANALVRLGFSKVCVMHKGVDVLRSTGILTVPAPQL